MIPKNPIEMRPMWLPPEETLDYETVVPEPTLAVCGTPEKVQELIRRFESGQDLFSPDDNRELVEPAYNTDRYKEAEDRYVQSVSTTAHTENREVTVLGAGKYRRGQVI